MNWTGLFGYALGVTVFLFLFRFPLIWFLGIRGLEQELKEANESLREIRQELEGLRPRQ